MDFIHKNIFLVFVVLLSVLLCGRKSRCISVSSVHIGSYMPPVGPTMANKEFEFDFEFEFWLFHYEMKVALLSVVFSGIPREITCFSLILNISNVIFS